MDLNACIIDDHPCISVYLALMHEKDKDKQWMITGSGSGPSAGRAARRSCDCARRPDLFVRRHHTTKFEVSPHITLGLLLLVCLPMALG